MVRLEVVDVLHVLYTFSSCPTTREKSCLDDFGFDEAKNKEGFPHRLVLTRILVPHSHSLPLPLLELRHQRINSLFSPTILSLPGQFTLLPWTSSDCNRTSLMQYCQSQWIGSLEGCVLNPTQKVKDPLWYDWGLKRALSSSGLKHHTPHCSSCGYTNSRSWRYSTGILSVSGVSVGGMNGHVEHSREPDLHLFGVILFLRIVVKWVSNPV